MTPKLITALFLALAGMNAAHAQDFNNFNNERRGPNVMPAPRGDVQSGTPMDRRGPNVMAMPSNPRTDAGTRSPEQAQPRREGPNIEGEATGFSHERERGRAARNPDAVAGCRTCVAI